MRHTVLGGNGICLNVEEAGNPAGPPILFIHGFSQCALTWRRQFNSSLKLGFRLVAMDIRGHGLSEKPLNAYDDGRLWADDVHAVVQNLHLEHPLLVAWSYGGFIVCDYLRYYGDQDISGINLVGAATKVNETIAPDVLGASFLALLPGLFSSDVEVAVPAIEEFLQLCGHAELAPEDRYLALGYNVAVPPHVRVSLLSRTIDNDDILVGIRCPVLITHGEQDAIVQLGVAHEHAAAIPGAQLSAYSDAGHAVFLDQQERFNRELEEFARTCAARIRSTAAQPASASTP